MPDILRAGKRSELKSKAKRRLCGWSWDGETESMCLLALCAPYVKAHTCTGKVADFLGEEVRIGVILDECQCALDSKSVTNLTDYQAAVDANDEVEPGFY